MAPSHGSDVDVQREHALERGDEYEQRDERAERHRDDRRRADGQRRPSGQGGRHEHYPRGPALTDGRAHRLVLGQPVWLGGGAARVTRQDPATFA